MPVPSGISRYGNRAEFRLGADAKICRVSPLRTAEPSGGRIRYDRSTAMQEAAKQPKFGPVKWKDPRFQPAIDNVRRLCALSTVDCEDDPFIGMCALPCVLFR